MSKFNEINDSVAAATYDVSLSPELEYSGGNYIHKVYRPCECFLWDVKALAASDEMERIGWEIDLNGNYYADVAVYELGDDEIAALKENPDAPITEVVPSVLDFDFSEIEYIVREKLVKLNQIQIPLFLIIRDFC